MESITPPANVDAMVRQVEGILEARGGVAPGKKPELTNAYASRDGRHAHFLFWYGVPNVYVVLVMAMPERSSFGHHRLDLNEKYGLPVPPDPTWWPAPVH